MKFFLVFIISTVSIHSHASEWTWEGFEIIGQKTVPKTEIQSLIPIKIGTKFQEDPETWRTWCENIESKYPSVIYSNCSPVRYSDFKAYFVVEIVEKGDEFRLSFRKNPSQSIPLAISQIVSKFETLQKRMWKLFELGTPAAEDTSKGYLDYSDKEMSAIVQQLIKLVPSHRNNLFRVIEFDKDPAKRAKAATLLNWAKNTEDSISRVHQFVNDDSGLVRNNISRFMLHYFDEVKSSEIRRNVISSLARQVWFPTHGDRNKAIYGLWEIAKNHPQDTTFIKSVALNGIKFLAENSILNNVQQPAQQLLVLINEK